MIQKYGSSFTYEFFYNDHIRRLLIAEHLKNDRWYFYPLSIAGGMFPWSGFVLAGSWYFLRQFRQKKIPVFSAFLGSWMIICLAVFQFAHSKLASYIFPLFPAVAVIVADFIYAAAGEKRKKTLTVLLLTTVGILFLSAIALIVCTFRFPHYVSSPKSIYVFVGIYVAFISALFMSILKRKYLRAVYGIGICLPALVYFAFLSHKEFDHFVSSKEAAEFVVEHYAGTSPLLCSKSFVRGVRYYTDMEVAAINMGDTFFFSPHPITYINKPKLFKKFFNANRLVFAIFTKSGFADAKRILHFMPQFHVELLKVIGDEYIVRIRFDTNLNKPY